MPYDLTQPSDPSLAPGQARCPGPSTRDIILQDNDGAPAALTAESYKFLSDADIPYARYTSQAFFDQEVAQMWSRTWQWACREEHIPNPGDYSVYDIAHYSVLVVRGETGAIKAFVNSCPHRGMQFFDSGTQGRGKQFLRCPFHGMSWNLDGSLREIPCRWDFPHVDDENFGLAEVNCETWGGFVFINLDRNAQPLHEYLGVLPEHFSDRKWDLQNRYVSLHMHKILPGNWKMCMEGVLEAYHVLATHPEGLRTAGDANADYDCFGDNVSRFVHTIGYPSPHLPKDTSEEDLFAALGRDPQTLPVGTSARQRHAELLRQEMGQQMGTDLSGYSNSEMLDSIEYHLFPNACFFPGINIRLIYRFRPLTVDTCVHEILLLDPVPEGKPRPKPAEVVKLGMDDSYTSVEGFPLGMVLDQDTDNFRRQWAGIKASTKPGETLGNYQESRIRHFHHTLDKYVSA